ncbi:V-type proton ATPase proteolipid subunit [Mycena chlorophos]|uniref:V-type proton ATPase proteolipid subunit n=1 Tax=Mycena chlorophos TaxID=658473 RepID=A0A8H6RXT4_MYCCL|nr:V-type proton ATPase proteolipid subunit [Mycena chlorophos]
MSEICPPYAPFFGFAGVSAAMVLSSALTAAPSELVMLIPPSSRRRSVWNSKGWHRDCGARDIQARAYNEGASQATAHGHRTSDESVPQSLIPVVMSGIIAVYGLVVSVLIAGSLTPDNYPLFSGFVHLGAGLACGITGMAAGYAIGLVGDSCVRAFVQEQKVFVGMVLILIFAEVLGLYGLIVALIMNTKATTVDCY